MTTPALRGEREYSGKEWADCQAPRQAAVVWGRVPGPAGSGGAKREQAPSHMPSLAHRVRSDTDALAAEHLGANELSCGTWILVVGQQG